MFVSRRQFAVEASGPDLFAAFLLTSSAIKIASAENSMETRQTDQDKAVPAKATSRRQWWSSHSKDGEKRLGKSDSLRVASETGKMPAVRRIQRRNETRCLNWLLDDATVKKTV